MKFYDYLFFGEEGMMDVWLRQQTKEPDYENARTTLDDYFNTCVEMTGKPLLSWPKMQKFRKQMYAMTTYQVKIMYKGKEYTGKIEKRLLITTTGKYIPLYELENLYQLGTHFWLDEPHKEKQTKKSSSTKQLLQQIYKKQKASQLEQGVFSQYVEYMNDESKREFLNKVLNGDREYFAKFVNTDLEDFADEVFTEKLQGDTRKKQTDMYKLLDEYDHGISHQNLLLLYKGVIMRLRTLPKDERRQVYTTLFNMSLGEFDKAEIMQKRDMLFTHFVDWLRTLETPKLQSFIDDVFDKDTKKVF